MNMKTDLDIFQYIRGKLKEQNARSIGQDGACRYRGYNASEYHKIDTAKYEMDLDRIIKINDFFDNPANKNLKCAVGHIISDEWYSEDFESMGSYDSASDVKLAVWESNPDWNMGLDAHKLLQCLQRVHDRYEPKEWDQLFDFLETMFNHIGDFVPNDSVLNKIEEYQPV